MTASASTIWIRHWSEPWTTELKSLVVQPTHLMHGAEYDELVEAIEKHTRINSSQVAVAEPLLGEVGDDAAVINADKEAVAKAVVAEEASEAGFKDAAGRSRSGIPHSYLMGHGTAHVAKVTYSQMQTQMQNLGYEQRIYRNRRGRAGRDFL